MLVRSVWVVLFIAVEYGLSALLVRKHVMKIFILCDLFMEERSEGTHKLSIPLFDSILIFSFLIAQSLCTRLLVSFQLMVVVSCTV